MTVLIIILAAITLALVLLRIAHGNAAQVGTVDDLQGLTEPLDLLAFLNLVDPAEEEYLRANLTPPVFRRVQRERLRAVAEYVRCAARNAAVLVRLGEATSAEAGAEVSHIGQQLVTAAIRVRTFAFLALCLLYVRMAIPDTRLSLFQVPSLYGDLIDRLGHLARLKKPAQASRILHAP